MTVLKRHQAESNGSPYVFASNLSSKGHVVSFHDAVQSVKALSAVTFTLHDLRRTYATILESMDVLIYALKSLLGDKMGVDVTGAHYTSIDIECLRPAAQRLEIQSYSWPGWLKGMYVRFTSEHKLKRRNNPDRIIGTVPIAGNMGCGIMGL